MSQLLALIKEAIQFVMGLKTAARQLLAVLLILLTIALITIYGLYKEIRRIEASIPVLIAAAVEVESKQSTAIIAVLNNKIESLEKAVSDEKREKYDFVKNLLDEQKRLNSKGLEVDKTQKRLARINRGHVNVIKKDAKQLIDVIQKQK